MRDGGTDFMVFSFFRHEGETATARAEKRGLVVATISCERGGGRLRPARCDETHWFAEL